MAISATAGVTASNASAATSIVTGTFAASYARDLVVAVALANTAASVSSITDTAGNTYALKSSATNGSSVRVELWQSQNITGNASNAVTVNVSASSLLAVAVQEYSGAADTTFAALDRTGWVPTVSDASFGAAANAIDGNTGTLWATGGAFPAWIVLDMLTPKTFTTFTHLPRQDAFQDYPGSIEIYVSTDGLTWGTAIYTQSGLPNTGTLKTFTFSSQTKRWLKYNILSQASGARIYQGAAEVNVGNILGSIPAQNTGNNTGSDYIPRVPTAIQDNGGYAIGAFAFASTSGDTFSASSGSTIRRSVVPALTSVAVAIADVIATGVATIPDEVRLSASRTWVAASLELRSGVTGAAYIDYTGKLPVDGVPLVKEQRFISYLMPTFTVFTPPSGGGNSGYTG
jgi:hypothetical protein